MRKLLIFVEQAFTIVSLLLYSGGPLTVILSDGANEGDLESGSSQIDSSLILVLFFVNYLIIGFLLILRWKKALKFLKKDKYLVILIGLAIVSVLWSYEPSKTINRGIAILGTTLFGVYLSSRYTMKQQLQILGWMFGLAVVLSFVFAVVLPKYGVMGGVHEGKWRGIYNHKTVLGKIMAPSAIVFLLLAIGSKKYRLFLWGGFFLSIILLLRSTAATSLLNLITLLAASVAYRVFRLSDKWLVPGLISTASTSIIFYIILSINTEALLGSLGKDTTLTGRADMWPYIFEMIWKNPVLGYGYGAFWSGPNTPSFYIWQATGWTPPNAHNGLLDIWLQIGLLGLLIFLFGFFTITLPKALTWLRSSRTSEGFWPMLYMTYMVLANLGETTLMVQNDLFWVIYVAVAFTVLTPPKQRKNYSALTEVQS